MSDSNSTSEPDRRKALTRRRFLYSAGACAAGVVGYGFGIEPRWARLERPVFKLPGLPAAFDGFKLAHVSDLHRSNVVSLGYIERHLDLAANLGADMVILTGDYVTGKAGYVHSLGPALERLAAALPTYAVLGNHDHWNGAETIEKRLRDSGIRMLDNTATKIERGSAHFWLLGTDDLMVGADDLGAAMRAAGEDSVRVLITHNPDSIEEVADAGIDLMLCGHTHGGQVAVPFIGPLIVPSNYGRRFAAGAFRVKATQLYGNRGLGLISPPVRLGVPPEVALITLHRASAATAGGSGTVGPPTVSAWLRSGTRLADQPCHTAKARALKVECSYGAAFCLRGGIANTGVP